MARPPEGGVVNPAAALSQVLVDELVRGGVTDAVLSPGSRSAPLAVALAAEGRIRLHVRIDERSAGFLAIGLAMVSGRPVPVLCTSGTAAANLHPAVLEASHAHVPLLVLTADRPPELRGTGANQATDQLKLYGDAVEFFAEVGVPEERLGMVAYWRSLVARALAASDRGPVHLNVAFRAPLTGGGDGDWIEPLGGRGSPGPWTAIARLSAWAPPDMVDAPERGAVVVGHGAVAGAAAAARRLAERLAWPLLSEPTGNARAGPNAVATYPLLLADDDFATRHAPALVLTVGKPNLSRSLLRFLTTAERHVAIDPHLDWADPTRSAHEVWPAVPVAESAGRPAADWLGAWLEADSSARRAVDELLDAEPVSEPRLARDLVSALPAGALLVAGSSRPARDLEAYARAREGVQVIGNRGLSGIDGLVSTAIGAALAHGGPSYALLGDLSLLHDANGLILGAGQPRPDLTLVVVDNNGGGIFSTLEPAASEPAFEEVFGTPPDVDLRSLAAATRTPFQELADLAQLPAALSGPGIRLLVVRTRRDTTAHLHRRLQAAVSAALSVGP